MARCLRAILFLCHTVGTLVRENDDMPRYNWDEVQRYYDAGHSYAECIQHFGFSPSTWTDAIERGCLKAKARQPSVLHYILSSVATRWNVRTRLLDEGLLRYECYECGISEGFGERLPLHLDHINGTNNDHRLENLRMLCPNCHSQTKTFGGRNAKRGKKDALGI